MFLKSDRWFKHHHKVMVIPSSWGNVHIKCLGRSLGKINDDDLSLEDLLGIDEVLGLEKDYGHA
jgi:hypothetical protein